jgi:hypothetical protein
VPKRVRGRARAKPPASRPNLISPKLAEEHREKIENSQPELAVEHHNRNGNNAVQVIVDVTNDIDRLAFENKFPIAAGATRQQRIRLIQRLKKRNLDLQAAVDPHIRGSRDAEYNYRIGLEEIIEEQKAVQDQGLEEGVCRRSSYR